MPKQRNLMNTSDKAISQSVHYRSAHTQCRRIQIQTKKNTSLFTIFFFGEEDFTQKNVSVVGKILVLRTKPKRKPTTTTKSKMCEGQCAS